MRLIRFGMILTTLVLLGGIAAYGQGNKKEGISGWDVVCVDGYKDGEFIPCEGFQSSGGTFSITREFLTNWSMASSKVSLTFTKLDDDPRRELKPIGVIPKTDENDKNWEYKFIGRLGGGNKRYFVTLFFYCKNAQRAKGKGNTGYCADGQYTGEYKFKDTKSDAVYTLRLTVNVKTLKSDD